MANYTGNTANYNPGNVATYSGNTLAVYSGNTANYNSGNPASYLGNTLANYNPGNPDTYNPRNPATYSGNNAATYNAGNVAFYNSPIAGNPGTPTNVLGVYFPGGASDTPAPYVPSTQVSYYDYPDGSSYPVTVPTGGQIVVNIS